MIEQICCLLRQRLNTQVLAIEPIATGLFNSSFSALLPDREVVVRVAPPADSIFCFYERQMMRQEPKLHRILLEKTNIPVPRILAYDFTGSLLPRDVIIMEKLPGRPMSECNLSTTERDGVLCQVGTYLRQAHAITESKYGYIGAHRPMLPYDKWDNAFAVMWHKLLGDIYRIGAYNTTEVARLSNLLKSHRRHFQHNPRSCLLHMDVWDQNVLIDDLGRITGLIDWDRSLYGDPEIEFAVLDYCSISRPAFWDGYGEKRDTSESATIRGHFYLLYELQKYIVISQGRESNSLKAQRYKTQVMDYIEANLREI